MTGVGNWGGSWPGNRAGSRGSWRAANPAAGPWPPLWQLSSITPAHGTGQTSPSGEPPGRDIDIHRKRVPADLLAIAPHLTDRDLMIASWLARHDVLTTPQIAQAFFTSFTTASHRLAQLRQLYWLHRFHRPHARGGFTAWHWVIGPLGAQWHAAARGENPPTPVALRRRWAQLAASPTLGHRLGSHQFFIDLHTPTGSGQPAADGDRLQWWLSANESSEAFLRRIHPDGTGRYGNIRFFLEHDMGSENISQLVQKLLAYGGLRADGGPGWPVLFHLPTERRETSLHTALAKARLPVPVATAVHGNPPNGRVWRLAAADTERLQLTQLPCHPPTNTLYSGGPL